MNFETKLNEMIERAGGVLGDIPWGSMRGQMHTLGTMTDEHLANSRHYHKHMAEVARVAPELFIDVEGCKFCQFLMEKAIDARKAMGSWTIPADDFRMAS
jgi:hypothetical protein